MLVEIYDCVRGNTLFKLELPVSEVSQYVALVKAHGCEDTDGNEYKFNDVKVFCDGFVIYVENA